MKLYYDSSTESAPEVINGSPPVDQSALVAQLQADLAAANAKLAAARAADAALTAALA